MNISIDIRFLRKLDSILKRFINKIKFQKYICFCKFSPFVNFYLRIHKCWKSLRSNFNAVNGRKYDEVCNEVSRKWFLAQNWYGISLKRAPGKLPCNNTTLNSTQNAHKFLF